MSKLMVRPDGAVVLDGYRYSTGSYTSVTGMRAIYRTKIGGDRSDQSWSIKNHGKIVVITSPCTDDKRQTGECIAYNLEQRRLTSHLIYKDGALIDYVPYGAPESEYLMYCIKYPDLMGLFSSPRLEVSNYFITKFFGDGKAIPKLY